MKVAVVCPYDLARFGGVQDQCLRLVRWLRRAGHEAWLVGPGSEGPEGTILVGGVTVIQANRAATPISLHPRSAAEVGPAVADSDCVHIHEPLVPMVSLAALLGGRAARVATFHADPPRSVRTAYRVGSPLLRRILRRVDVTTAVSPVAAAAVNDLVSPRIIPNGIDLGDYEDRTEDKASVVFVGRDDERKGLSVLLDAWPRVHAVVPHATLTVVGAGRRREIPGVAYRGEVAEADKRAELARAAVYCAPNLGGESFGITLVEAMASGCAIVASALPGFVHVLDGAGRLVAPGDADGLARALIELVSDAGRLEEARHQARQRAPTYDGTLVAEAYLEAYRQAVAHRSARGSETG